MKIIAKEFLMIELPDIKIVEQPIIVEIPVEGKVRFVGEEVASYNSIHVNYLKDEIIYNYYTGSEWIACEIRTWEDKIISFEEIKS